MPLDRNIQDTIDFLISKLQKQEALTPYEYSELLKFSREDLDIVINNLYDDEDEYSFFDLDVSYYPNNYENFISMADDRIINYQYEEFPILSFALRNQDIQFAENLLENINSPQHTQTEREDIVTTQDSLGQTPLHIAVWLNQYHISNRLIQSGADVNDLNGTGHSSLIESDDRTQEGEQVKDLLESHGAQYIINTIEVRTTPSIKHNVSDSSSSEENPDDSSPLLGGDQTSISWDIHI